MSVLIKGMEMPKNCYDCPLNYDTIDCMVADIALREKGGGDFLYEHERASHCPLVPVPKHGRLIDADALLKGCERVATKYATREYAFSQSALDNAPTVIPAEEGE